MAQEKNKKTLSPKLDVVFQALFGEVGNERITKAFLQEILKEKIDKIELNVNPILRRETVEDKMAQILDGKKLRDKILEELKVKIDRFEIKPTLVVILVGENPASKIYVNNKKKTAEKLGINSEIINYPSNVSEKEILDKIEELNNDENVTAILVQLPLPEHISKENIMNKIYV